MIDCHRRFYLFLPIWASDNPRPPTRHILSVIQSSFLCPLPWVTVVIETSDRFDMRGPRHSLLRISVSDNTIGIRCTWIWERAHVHIHHRLSECLTSFCIFLSCTGPHYVHLSPLCPDTRLADWFRCYARLQSVNRNRTIFHPPCCALLCSACLPVFLFDCTTED